MSVQSSLTIEVYSSGSTQITDPNNLLQRAEDIHFATCYPGGIYTTASFFIPLDVTRWIPLKHAYRVVIRDGTKLVWEGWLAEITFKVDPGRSGIEVSCLGLWSLLFHQYKYNRWVDRRYDGPNVDMWYAHAGNANEKCTFDKRDRLMFIPKPEAWSSGEFAVLRYHLNGSSNVKQANFSYDLQEGAQAWELMLYDFAHSASLWTTASSGSGDVSLTLSGSSSGILEFRLYSRAAQTPTSSSIYGKITNLSMLAENSSGCVTTTPTQILQASIQYQSGGSFSACTNLIGSNTYDLTNVGIVDDGWNRSVAEFMMEVAKLSSDGSKWNVGILESEAVAGETGGILYYEQEPDLSDYDYILGIDEDVIVGGFDLVSSAMPDDVWTRAWVKFKNTRGQEDWNYADRTISNSIKSRSGVVIAPAGVSSTASASALAETIIATKQKTAYYIGSPITIKGFLRAKTGERVPASWIRSGKRLKIMNFLSDFGDEAPGTGFTFLISQTEYNDSNGTNRLTLGRPDSAALNMALSAPRPD